MIKIRLNIIIILIFLYIFSTEFIFPLNKFLPSVQVLWLSLNELIFGYNLLHNLFDSLFSIIVTLLILFITSKYLLPVFYDTKLYSIPLEKNIFINFFLMISYVPFFVIVILSLVWFSNFSFSKEIILLIALFPVLSDDLFNQKFPESRNYFDFYFSLGKTESWIKRKIIRKLYEPIIFNSVRKVHKISWSIVLLIEFLQDKHGIGTILRTGFNYNDVSLIITTALIIIILVIMGEVLLEKISEKIYFWN